MMDHEEIWDDVMETRRMLARLAARIAALETTVRRLEAENESLKAATPTVTVIKQAAA